MKLDVTVLCCFLLAVQIIVRVDRIQPKGDTALTQNKVCEQVADSSIIMKSNEVYGIKNNSCPDNSIMMKLNAVYGIRKQDSNSPHPEATYDYVDMFESQKSSGSQPS